MGLLKSWYVVSGMDFLGWCMGVGSGSLYLGIVVLVSGWLGRGWLVGGHVGVSEKTRFAGYSRPSRGNSFRGESCFAVKLSLQRNIFRS